MSSQKTQQLLFYFKTFSDNVQKLIVLFLELEFGDRIFVRLQHRPDPTRCRGFVGFYFGGGCIFESGVACIVSRT